MGSLPYWITSRLPYYKDQQDAIAEEQRKIKEKAARYDQLINVLGFQDFLLPMKEKIAAEITEATSCPLEPEKQRIHVIRWNAMREVLDAAQNDVIDTRKERDRIREEELDYLRLMHLQGREEANG